MNAEEVLAKIEAVKADFNTKLDEIASSVQGEETSEPMEEAEAPAEPMADETAPEAPAEGEPVAPVAIEEKKVMFGKKKPGGDLRKALGI